MKKNISTIYRTLVFSLIFTLFFGYSLAASLSLLKIGSLDTEGKNYPEWWYVGKGPVFSGMATPGSAVSIKIGENSYTATPDTTGNWSYSAILEKGDYPIEISQGEEKISFTLHMGQDKVATAAEVTQPSNTAPDTVTVPDTGYNQYVAFSFGVGIILLATYFYFSSDSKKNTIFESRVLKED